MPTREKFRCSITSTVLWQFASTSQSGAQTYTVTDLGTPSVNSVSKAYALNNAEKAARTSSIPTAGSNGVSGFAINDNSEIAGAIYFSSGAPAHAARFNNGVQADLGAIVGAASSTAQGINLAGQIVAKAIFRQTQYPSPKPGKHVPFISTSGALADLNSLIPSGTGFTFSDRNNTSSSEHARSFQKRVCKRA